LNQTEGQTLSSQDMLKDIEKLNKSSRINVQKTVKPCATPSFGKTVAKATPRKVNL